MSTIQHRAEQPALFQSSSHPGYGGISREKRYLCQHTFQIESHGKKHYSKQAGKKTTQRTASKSNDDNQDRSNVRTIPKAPKQKRIPLTTEERKERQNRQKNEKRATAKTLGLCRDCHEPANEGKSDVMDVLRNTGAPPPKGTSRKRKPENWRRKWCHQVSL